MAIHWTIAFKSLRSGTDYRVNIYDANYSGSSSIHLKGAAEPFTTEEDDDEDMFVPLRLQSGYIRIVDDGKDANGNAFDWRTLIPANDKSRPVTLTKTVGSQQQIVWQGFMQAQNFSGELYSYTQEREFPVQCCLSVLSTTQVPTTEPQPRNFAYLLKTCLDAIPQHTISQIVVQGGTDARDWLMKMIDWRVFLEMDNDDEYAAKYNLQEALEDLCRFWGWTARTKGQTLYLVMADDHVENTFLTLTRAQLNTLANGTAVGDTSSTFVMNSISGDVFASDDNDDNYIRGYNKCVVKGSIEDDDVLIKFAPESVKKQMEATGWTWVHPQEDEEGVGYYTTQLIPRFNSSALEGNTYGLAGFCSRQVYSSVDEDKPAIIDAISVWGGFDGNVRASLQTKKMMMFTGGSLTVKGSVYRGAHKAENNPTTLKMKIGIGEDRNHAKWWNLYSDINITSINHSWGNFIVIGTLVNGLFALSNGDIKGSSVRHAADNKYVYNSFPCDANGLYGYLFIDIIGCHETDWLQSFEVADLEVKYSRDSVFIPTSPTDYRQRDIVRDRKSSREYTATNNGNVDSPYNIDCIFASDNYMKFGYGLVMDSINGYMTKANYGQTQQEPEQHLANRAAAYWASTKRKIVGEFRANTISDISPNYKVTMDGTTFYPVAISRNWRDDIVTLTLQQL